MTWQLFGARPACFISGLAGRSVVMLWLSHRIQECRGEKKILVAAHSVAMQTCKSSREASPLAKRDHSEAEAKGLVSKDLLGLHFPRGLLSIEKGLPKLVYFSIKTLIPRENSLLAPLISLLVTERVQARLWPAYVT